MEQEQKILVMDFGAQYAQLIARRVRECSVYSIIRPYDISVEEIKEIAPTGIIFSGGPRSVYDKDAPRIDKEIFDLGIPILGICYGMQIMSYTLDGKVKRAEQREYGKTELSIIDQQGLFADVESEMTVWMSHSDHVLELPAGFVVTGKTQNTPNAAVANHQRKLYGVQFHPEVVHTPHGMELIRNFIFEICGCKGNWTATNFIEEKVEEVRKQVGNKKAICGLSGGVDSAVASVLVQRAIGDQLTCIFVNHGFLRKGEAEQVYKTFTEQFDINLVYVDASERFIELIEGVTEPEEKRKLIGNEFVRVFEEEAAKIGDANYLVQGTIYSDVIESGTDKAAKIKTHHNVGGLPEDMEFELVEPLNQVFKDEVRSIGKALGLPDDIVWRQPFPGPGLAIRIIGDVNRENLNILREADAIVREEIKTAGLSREIWQYFAVLPANIRSVGVMGDERTYASPIAIRAVKSEDAMTADWARIPYEVLEKISTRVTNEVEGVNRVVYDITSKPPGTIEWE